MDRSASPPRFAPLTNPEDLLERAGWFRTLVRALAADGGRRPSSARITSESSTEATGVGSRGAARAETGVLAELRLQEELLRAIDALVPAERDALVDAFFHARPALEVRAPRVQIALDALRARLDTHYGGRERWLAVLPEWALRPVNDAGAARGGARLDRGSRALLGFAVLLVAGFALWSAFGRRESSTVSACPPTVPLTAIQAMDAPRSVVQGTLRMSGFSFEGWRCWLAPALGANAPVIVQSMVRSDGTFRLETSARGEFELHVQDLPGAGASHRLVRSMILDGTEQRADFETPSFVARGGDERLAGKDLVHAWTNSSGWTFATRIHLDAAGRFTNLTLPSGPSSLSVLGSNEAFPASPQELSDLAPAGVELEQHF